MHRELLVDLLHMCGNRMWRNRQQSCDLGEVESLGDERENVRFAHRQPGFVGLLRMRSSRAGFESLQQLTRDDRADRRSTRAKLLDQADELFGEAVLKDVPRRASLDG